MEQLGLDWVSPLPPVRSGIADYSLDLVPHLAEQCDLRLVRVPGQPVEAQVAERFPVVAAHELGNGGRLPVYQMGNNRHHREIHSLAMERPGVVTLHDLVLHHFLIEGTAAAGDFDAYSAALTQDHGWIGDAASRPLQWPGGAGTAVQFALPAHRTLLTCQRGVVVHSHWAADLLREEIEGLKVRPVPMGVPLPPAADPAAGEGFRMRHGFPVDVPLLGSFGFQTPIKRTEVAIRALARPELATVHLLVAGEVAPICRLEEIAAEVGVADRVRFLGFLPFADLETAISAVDICLNLRYPTAGETSASLLRVLAVGKPTVVSDYAQFAELPSAGVVKVAPSSGEDGSEEEALATRLRDLLAAPERLVQMGEEARRHVEREHAPTRAAAAMVEACQELSSAEPLGRGVVAFPPPTSIAWHAFSGVLDVEGAELPWLPGTRRRLRVRFSNHGEARWLAAEREGGLAVEVRLVAEAPERDLRAGEGWLGLPIDLEPGESHVFDLEIRRPVGPARLEIIPHVLGMDALEEYGGPSWRAEI